MNTRLLRVAQLCLSLLPNMLCMAAEQTSAAQADLLAVYQKAALNDAQLSAARHAYRAQQEAVPQARAGLLPNLTAGATSEITRLDRDEPSLKRDRSGTTFRANLSQPLFRIDRWFQLKAAQSSVSQAELELSDKRVRRRHRR